MNYATQKILIIVFGSFLMVIGGASVVYGDSITALGGTMIIFIALFIMIKQLKQLSTFQKMTYAWYKSENPQHVQGSNLFCYLCGSTRINVRALMSRTFHREHFCTQFGNTLYNSREQS